MFLKRAAASWLGVGLICAVTGAFLWAAEKGTPQDTRNRLTKAHRDGNYKVAYEGLRKLALSPNVEADKVGGDLALAINCLQRLGRSDEIDEFREAVIAAHGQNWRLLSAAANTFLNTEHHGYIVAGQFHRGNRRGTGKFVSTFQRDRVRAMQLLQQGLSHVAKEPDKAAAATFHKQFADLILTGVGNHESWRLQYLTDLTKLPDYEEGNVYWGRGRRWGGFSGDSRGAPVDEQNRPVYYNVPKTYPDATNDGERWRWMLARVVELAPSRASEIDMHLAQFFRSQFGVQTMASFGWRGQSADDGGDRKTGTFALHTLKDSETIAKLASGLQRIQLPDEFNWIKIWERVAGRGKGSFAEQARDNLAREFTDRRQYVKAADAWRKAIAEYGNGTNNYRKNALEQIVSNWGRFEPINTQPGGLKAVLDYRFRNGKKVHFEAHAVKVETLLDDVKAYLKGNPAGRNLNWQQANIGDLGYRLVEQNQVRYKGARVAAWSLDLKPRKGHVDDRVQVTTPIDRPGAYLIEGRMEDGNISRVIVWLADTAIVKKQLDGKVFYFVADAVTGMPVAKANLEFFGWRNHYINPNQWRIETSVKAEHSDKDGQVLMSSTDLPTGWNWLVTARKKGDAQGGLDRFAYLGFTGVWYGRRYDPEYNATRVFGITDRPVYRPEHTVKFKAWMRHAKYDQPNTSDFANRDVTVVIRNPKGDKVYEKRHTTDAYAGLDGELKIGKDFTLGVYRIHFQDAGRSQWHVGTFRVEEYKKPEYEVKIEAPTEPVRLGEKIEARIEAKYYFGAPVTRAKVKYKVLRTEQKNTWYPTGAWDWFYGPGYWWFVADYDWFPGFREWGCCRPVPFWWHQQRHDPPEVVLENEVEIGPDGTVKVVIDTAPAKELHGNQDHSYSITAEVVDESRRTIVGSGNVLVSRKPFSVFTWVDRGYYRAGDTVKANFRALTLDRKPVQGKGDLSLIALSYKNGQPIEKVVQTWKLDTNAVGLATQQLKAARPGQYRLSYKLTDAKKHTIEGGYVFVVRGAEFTGKEFRFNDIELVTDKREYQPGDKAQVLINTNRQDGTVLLFVRPTNGIYLPPRVVRIKGKSTVEEVAVVQKDMPNFFVEAVTVHGGRVHSDVREIVVPPEKRVLTVEVLPNKHEYKPGEKATVKVKLSDFNGKPFVGAAVLSAYDRSVDYISGGSNVPQIKEFFWKWRRSHYPSTEHSLARYGHNLLKRGEVAMGNLGIFGDAVIDEMRAGEKPGDNDGLKARRQSGAKGDAAPAPAPGAPARGGAGPGGGFGGGRGEAAKEAGAAADGKGGQAGGGADVQPTIRKNFADTAFWAAKLITNKDGVAEVTFPMPEQLTGWKLKVWGMGHGTKVGEGEIVVTTKKDLLVRMQAPRFFTQKDEVVLSANVHNYLKSEKEVTVALVVEGDTLRILDKAVQKIKLAAGGERRVDWRVKVANEGKAVVTMRATTDEESDAMQMSFPAYVHGMLKMESFSGVIRPEKDAAKINFTVPSERRVPQTLLEVQYSPTLAGAMVDALPYMVDYPYGCTEQTLNRFLPTVITQRTLQRMKVDLKDVQKKRTNLNAGELGDAKGRAKQWQRYPRNPVFDEAEVLNMSKAGVTALTSMQCADGGWGWFSGWGERSYPHTTAVVVHGLSLAKANDIALVPNTLERGIEWLKGYQREQIRKIKNAPQKTWPYKLYADNTDALVYMVLCLDGNHSDAEMRDFLYRDRTHIGVYAKAMFGLALHKEQQAQKLAMILQNIEQYVVEDNENQTAYLRLPAGNYWWYWYGSEIEANAYYLKLLSATNPKDKRAAGLVKYLLNNRKHATYWNSTRDTAICIEAMADYLKASGEDKPDMTVEVWLDGKKVKEAKIDSSNLFTFDNRFAIGGDKVTDGKHTIEIKKKGRGPVYFNAYLTNFTLEDFITKAGLEVKVNRKYYRLVKLDEKIKVRGARGQAGDRKVEKFQRVEIKSGEKLKSGDLVEVELEIDSKNDYEYLLFEDPRAAGFEPLAVRSGYGGNDMGAYMEVRDDRVCFFVRVLARGKHSVSYRMRAEIPGRFSALPAKASAMYAPELKGNSDEIKIAIED